MFHFPDLKHVLFKILYRKIELLERTYKSMPIMKRVRVVEG